MKLEALGFWFNDRAPSAYPRPQLLVGKWPAKQRTQVLAHLRAGMVFESYRARSYCRFACGIANARMGHRDLSDGVYVWPEGLAHYVEAHAVRLPERFIRHALADPDPPAVDWTHREGLIDETAWLAWGRKQGAVLDLAGWERPGWELQRTLTAALKAAKRPRTEILLVHPATREVIVHRNSGQLAIVQLVPPFPMRQLAGWHEWPAATKSTARSP